LQVAAEQAHSLQLIIGKLNLFAETVRGRLAKLRNSVSSPSTAARGTGALI
jgi:hypothetical protein